MFMSSRLSQHNLIKTFGKFTFKSAFYVLVMVMSIEHLELKRVLHHSDNFFTCFNSFQSVLVICWFSCPLWPTKNST